MFLRGWVAAGSLDELRIGVASALTGVEHGQRLSRGRFREQAGQQEPTQELSWLA